MQKVLITGINGLIASHISALLLREQYEVVGTYYQPDGTPSTAPGIRTHCISLEDAPAWGALMAQEKPDYVIHLAGRTFVQNEDKLSFYNINALGTEHVLKGIETAGITPIHTIIASTAGVYGNQQAEFLDENLAMLPVNHYSMSKAVMEWVVRNWSHPAPVTLLRPFNIIGTGQKIDFLIPKIVAHFAQKAPNIELGNIDTQRDYLDVRDFARAVLHLLRNKPAFSEVNLCASRGTTARQVLGMMEEITGHSLEIRINPKFVRSNDILRLVGCNKRLQSTGFDTSNLIPLKQTLEWIYADQLQQVAA